MLLAACQSAPPQAADETGSRTIGNWTVKTSGSVAVDAGVVAPR